MRFRPCIDLHDGKVVQIVGSSLYDDDETLLRTNFASDREPADYARLYRDSEMPGGHVISLGKGNQQAAFNALGGWPGGMQYGGGVNPDNAGSYLDAGASHVIVTSFVFSDGSIDYDKLEKLVSAVGSDKLVLDLSCRRKKDKYYVVTDRWQRFTKEVVNAFLLDKLAKSCAEFLVHGVDVEGKKQGIEEELVELLGAHSPLPVTYAGGVNQLSDLDLVRNIGRSRVDLTIGSALDIFGGDVRFADVASWHKAQQKA